jgi:hypothetical protein
MHISQTSRETTQLEAARNNHSNKRHKRKRVSFQRGQNIDSQILGEDIPELNLKHYKLRDLIHGSTKLCKRESKTYGANNQQIYQHCQTLFCYVLPRSDTQPRLKKLCTFLMQPLLVSIKTLEYIIQSSYTPIDLQPGLNLPPEQGSPITSKENVIMSFIMLLTEKTNVVR